MLHTLDPGCSFLSGRWTPQGLVLLFGMEASGNVAQLRSWDGSLLWELQGRSLPGFDWLDAVVPLGEDFILLGTNYGGGGGGAGLRRSLQWRPGWSAPQPWPTGEDVLFPLLHQHLADVRCVCLEFLGDGSVVIGGNGKRSSVDHSDDGDDQEVFRLWRLKGPEWAVTAEVTLENAFVLEMRESPHNMLQLRATGGEHALIQATPRQLQIVSRTRSILLKGDNDADLFDGTFVENCLPSQLG